MATFDVLPTETIPGHIINVSLADTLVPMVWIKQVLFWQIEKQIAYDQAFEDLRDGLSRLITEIPALAGHLTRREHAGPRDISIAVEGNASIEFQSRTATALKLTPSFQDFESNGFPVERVDKDFYPKEASDPVTEGSSLFWARLNRIKGGAVLVFGFNHVLTDGWSCAEIERLWSLHTADASEDVPFRRHKVGTPDIEIRKQLSTPSPPQPIGKEKIERGGLSSVSRIFPEAETLSYLHPDLKSFKAAIRKTVFRMLKRLIITGSRLEPRSLAIWRLSLEGLAKLKQATSHANAEGWISTKDALAGLFWSRLCAIQKRKTLADEKVANQISTCLFVLNVRKRLSPNVPDDYIGNVVGSTIAQCSVSELSSLDIEGVRRAAQSLRRANQAWSESTFKGALGAVLKLPPGKAFGLDRDFLIDKQNLFYDDFSSLQSNTLDWGVSLGSVAKTRFPSAALPAGASTIIVHPKFLDGGLEVSLTCTEATRRALDADEVFRRYATLVCHDCPSQRGVRHFLMNALWWWVSRLGRFWWWREVVEFKKKA